MSWLTLILISLILIALQVFLSMQKNKWLGLILPGISVLLLYFAPYILSISFTSIFLALMPVSINLIIYFVCRKILKEKNVDEINRMKINDL